MAFRWSAGDIAECVKLLIKIGTVLKDSRDSTAEYQSTVDFLKGVETTVQGVGNILQNHPGLTLQAAFEEHAAALLAAVTRFKEKIEGYDASLGANATASKTKKTWREIRLTLFGHIEELKLAVSYPQSVVNDLIGLQGLDILLNLSEKPTLSPQQFQDSTDEILRNFPILDTAIETLRSDIAVHFTTMQQTTESTAQSHFDQIRQNLSDGNILQRSFTAQAQADTEARDLWRSQVQISISEIQAKAQQHVEALQEVKQTQETNNLHSMQAALQAFSWRNVARPATSRPIVTVIRKTVIKNVRPPRNAPATRDGSSQGGSSQKGNSQGGKSQGGSSRGVGSQGGISRGESSRGGSKQVGGDPGRVNGRGGESSRGSSLGASRSRGGLPSRGSNSRGGDSRGGISKRGSSKGGNTQGGDSRGGSSKGGSNPQGSGSQGDNSRGGSANRGPSTRGNSRGGGSSRGGNAQGGNSRGSNSSGGGAKRGSSFQGGDARGGSANRGTSTRGNSRGGGSSRGGISRGNNNIRRGSGRGK
ncbi:hypothetical protein V8E51_001224 [Hyaloscypha variabilis]